MKLSSILSILTVLTATASASAVEPARPEPAMLSKRFFKSSTSNPFSSVPGRSYDCGGDWGSCESSGGSAYSWGSKTYCWCPERYPYWHKSQCHNRPPPSYAAKGKRTTIVSNEVPLNAIFDTLEQFTSVTSCPFPEHGCKTASGDYECLDVTSTIDSCGGCVSSGHGVNCLELPGAMGVGCANSKCEIYSCMPGYTFHDGTCVLTEQE